MKKPFQSPGDERQVMGDEEFTVLNDLKKLLNKVWK
jgi:hypothetical protein